MRTDPVLKSSPIYVLYTIQSQPDDRADRLHNANNDNLCHGIINHHRSYREDVDVDDDDAVSSTVGCWICTIVATRIYATCLHPQPNILLQKHIKTKSSKMDGADSRTFVQIHTEGRTLPFITAKAASREVAFATIMLLLLVVSVQLPPAAVPSQTTSPITTTRIEEAPGKGEGGGAVAGDAVLASSPGGDGLVAEPPEVVEDAFAVTPEGGSEVIGDRPRREYPPPLTASSVMAGCVTDRAARDIVKRLLWRRRRTRMGSTLHANNDDDDEYDEDGRKNFVANLAVRRERHELRTNVASYCSKG